jgi:flagellin
MSQGSVVNPTAFEAYTQYTLNGLALNTAMRRLASGVKSVADDGAGVAISERMRSQANSTAQARENVDNAVSLLATADSWLQQINDLLKRMHELAVDANDATKTATDKANIQTEFASLQQEVLRITNGSSAAATYNGLALFGSTFASGADVQVGADTGQVIQIQLADLTSASTQSMGGGLAWAEVLADAASCVSVATAASTALTKLSSAVGYIANVRASIGAQQGRFEKARAGLINYEDQIRAAENRIRTIDTARESSEMVKNQILTQIGTAILAQANQLPAQAVQLVGGG